MKKALEKNKLQWLFLGSEITDGSFLFYTFITICQTFHDECILLL